MTVETCINCGYTTTMIKQIMLRIPHLANKSKVNYHNITLCVITVYSVEKDYLKQNITYQSFFFFFLESAREIKN